MNAISEYKSTIILCGLTAFVASPIHAGFVLLFLVPIFIFWIPYSLFVIWRQTDRRRTQAVRLIMWVLVLTLISGVHWYYAYAARNDAQFVVRQLLLYKEQRGMFPSNLDEVGIDALALRKRWMLHYSRDQNQPALFYATTFTAFETYSYDFKTKAWHDNSD